MNSLKEAGEDIVGGLLSGVKTIWTDATTFFEGVGATIVGYFKDALTWLERGR